MPQLAEFEATREEYDNNYSEKVTETAPKREDVFFEETVTVTRVTNNDE